MIAALMPWNDWQFWLATALAIAGVWLALRPLLAPKNAKGCASCAFAQKTPPLPSGERLVGLGRSGLATTPLDRTP